MGNSKMAKIDPLGMIGNVFGEVIKFLDDAYKQGYLLYLIVGLIVLAVFVIFFN